MLVEKHSGGGVVIVLVLYNIYSMRLVYMMLQRARLGALCSCWGLQVGKGGGGERAQLHRGGALFDSAVHYINATHSMLLCGLSE